MSAPTYELSVCKWEGRVHCVYLNDTRIAGGKPWGGADDMKTWPITAADLRSAIPELRTPLEKVVSASLHPDDLSLVALRFASHGDAASFAKAAALEASA